MIIQFFENSIIIHALVVDYKDSLIESIPPSKINSPSGSVRSSLVYYLIKYQNHMLDLRKIDQTNRFLENNINRLGFILMRINEKNT